MTTNNLTDTLPGAATSKSYSRSSVEFPYQDLQAGGVDVAKGIFNSGGVSCDIAQLAASLKMQANGGAFRVRMSSAKMFGLIAYERGTQISLTELGKRVLQPETERTAKVEAFLTVSLFQKMYEQFKGSQLPPQSAMENTLINFGVGENVAKIARQVLTRSARTAGFFDAANDRLVKPSIRADESKAVVEDKLTSEPLLDDGRYRKAEGGNQHPAFELLLNTLPAPGSSWEIQDRMNWLVLANSAFNIIYKPAIQNNEKIQITLSAGLKAEDLKI